MYQAVEVIDEQLTDYGNTADNIVYNILPEHFMDIARARDGNREYTALTDAVGRVSSGYIYAYPPGIPLLAPGEVFTRELAGEILKMINCGLNVKGVDRRAQQGEKTLGLKDVFVSVTAAAKPEPRGFMGRRKKQRGR